MQHTGGVERTVSSFATEGAITNINVGISRFGWPSSHTGAGRGEPFRQVSFYSEVALLCGGALPGGPEAEPASMKSAVVSSPPVATHFSHDDKERAAAADLADSEDEKGF